MSKLKPVASYFESPGNAEECVPAIRKIDFGVRGGKWKPLHYIPDTHRVVSVELLLDALDWVDDLSTFTELRAIIDNKGATE
jgi:hypothetical protein